MVRATVSSRTCDEQWPEAASYVVWAEIAGVRPEEGSPGWRPFAAADARAALERAASLTAGRGVVRVIITRVLAYQEAALGGDAERGPSA